MSKRGECWWKSGEPPPAKYIHIYVGPIEYAFAKLVQSPQIRGQYFQWSGAHLLHLHHYSAITTCKSCIALERG
ncbi:hypothetical protein FA13DRAFT_1726986 [Coprinellus micaceus]|uniref:Uncharacterized protein n=1 Tax=Coprinellus micaceus TaxID=71717 RepID=A0A4Y7TSQ6_COPMI|nr:hypothetical protein FA13DRAFT_1726986 [Coprinellus micaceus]